MLRKRFLLFLACCFLIYGIKAQSWSALDGDLFLDDGTGQNGGGVVLALHSYKDKLYVGGAFTKAGNVTTIGIASWDGVKWDSLGAGITGYGEVYVITDYYNELYIGGSFHIGGPPSINGKAVGNVPNTNTIARWNGTSWSSVGSGGVGVTSSIQDLAEYKDELYAGGNFDSLGGVGCCIAKWNGTNWSDVGSGLYGSIECMAVFNGELYVGGKFASAGGIDAYNIARWDGNQWKPVGLGIGMYEICRVTSLAVDTVNNILYAGGTCYYAHNSDSSEVVINYISKWDGTTWSSVGSGFNSAVYYNSLAMYHGDLYAGGDMTWTGTKPLRYIARWDGIEWFNVGGGFNNPVDALAVYKDTLYAGGYFTMASFNSAYYIAKWYSTDTTVGIAEIKSADYELDVYPNPTKESFTVKINIGSEKGAIKIYDINGELISDHKIKQGKTAIEIKTSTWSYGIYLCTLEVEGKAVKSKKMGVE